MTAIPLIFVAIILFFIGIICPHLAGKIQNKTNKESGRLKRLSNWLWDPITWWAKMSIESTRKIIDTVTQWGKKTRKKIVKKKNTDK